MSTCLLSSHWTARYVAFLGPLHNLPDHSLGDPAALGLNPALHDIFRKGLRPLLGDVRNLYQQASQKPKAEKVVRPFSLFLLGNCAPSYATRRTGATCRRCRAAEPGPPEHPGRLLPPSLYLYP